MTNKTSFFFTAVFSLLFTVLASTAQAETSVWKVSKGESELYIGGTIHLLKESDHPLPKEFETAYLTADKLYFETDTEKASTPEFGALMMQKLMLQNGKTLKDVLKPDTYAQLSEYIASIGMPMQQLESFTPSGVVIMTTVIVLTQNGFRPDLGVDATYLAKAKADNKQTGELETIEEQLDFIANMSGGKDDEIILYTLRDLKRFDAYINDLKNAWRSGNLARMEKTVLTELKRDFPAAHKSLLVTRNNNWMKKIVPMFDSKEKEFILVGALHLVGDDGLLSQLEKLGFSIEQL